MPRPIDVLGLAPKREVDPHEDGTFTVYITPPAVLYPGREPCKVHLSADQYDRYCKWRIGGGLVQDFFPELSADVREMLISGLLPSDFEALKEDDDDC